jgi:hypothetical protein
MLAQRPRVLGQEERFMRMNLLCGLSLAAWATLAVGIGCGGSDDEEEAPAIRSGVAGDKTLSELSSAEAVKVCQALGDAVEVWLTAHEDDFLRTSCVSLSLFTASSAQECRQSVDACLDQLADAGPGEITGGGCDPASAEVTDCTATVAELESCLGDTLDSAVVALQQLDCELLFSAGASSMAAPQDPPSCAPLREKCPELFTEVSDVGGGMQEF